MSEARGRARSQTRVRLSAEAPLGVMAPPALTVLAWGPGPCSHTSLQGQGDPGGGRGRGRGSSVSIAPPMSVLLPPGPSGPQPAPCCCSSVAKACLTLLRPCALRKVFLLHLLRFLPPAAPPERAATRSIHRAWEGSREGYLQSIFFLIGSHF